MLYLIQWCHNHKQGVSWYSLSLKDSGVINPVSVRITALFYPNFDKRDKKGFFPISNGMTAFFQFLTGWQHFCVSLKKPDNLVLPVSTEFHLSFQRMTTFLYGFHQEDRVSTTVSKRMTELSPQIPIEGETCQHRFQQDDSAVTTYSNKMTAQLPHITTRWQRSYYIFHQDDSAVTTYSNKMTAQLLHIPTRW